MLLKNVLAVLLSLIVVFSVSGCSKKSSVNGVNSQNEPSAASSDESGLDAESYYKANAKIIAQIPAGDSRDVPTEVDAEAFLVGRGFDQYSISADYSESGEMRKDGEIETPTNSIHPMYQTYYVTENGDLWTIYVINGQIFANPVSYNLQSIRDAQLIISETKTVMSYDSETNTFYETIPNESELIVKIVDRIDSQALEKLSIEEIDKL